MFTLLSIFVAFVLFGVLVGDPRRVHARRRARRRRPAGHAAQGRLHDARCRKATGPRMQTVQGVDRRHALDLVRRVLPGPRRTSSRNMAVDPEPFLQMYPSSSYRRTRRRPGSRTAPARSSAAHGRAVRLEGRRPHSAHQPRSSTGRTARPGRSRSDGIYTAARKGVDDTQFFFHHEYLTETFRGVEFIEGNVGWYIIRVQRSGRNADQVAQQHRRAVRELGERDEDLHREAQFVQTFAKQIGDIGSIVTGDPRAPCSSRILLVAGNTMAQSIRERTSELGGAQDARVHRRQGARARPAGVGASSRSLGGGAGLLVGVAARVARATRRAGSCPPSTIRRAPRHRRRRSSSAWASRPASCRRSRRTGSRSSTRCGGTDVGWICTDRRGHRAQHPHHPAAARLVRRRRRRHRGRGHRVHRGALDRRGLPESP